MKMDKCPHCGSTKGLESNYSIHDCKMLYSFDGSFVESMRTAFRTGGKKLFCGTCGKYVCMEDEFLSREEEKC